jgi:uncharacterized protein (TIGR03435 family)
MSRRIGAVILPLFFGISSALRIRAQTPGPQPQFEVASIKLATEGAGGSLTQPFPGGRLRVRNQSVRALIRTAYRVQDYQIFWGPGWIDSNRYDIEAKGAGNPPLLQVVGPMLQSLLEDRFKLRVHHETKELSIYALVVAKSGLQLRPSKEGSCTPYDPGYIPPPGQKRPTTCGTLAIGKNTLEATMIGMKELTESLSYILGRTVIDRTGFTKRFDVHLEFAPGEAPPTEVVGPSLFTALQQQLGLKLESTKGPVDVLVIDEVEKPSAN